MPAPTRVRIRSLEISTHWLHLASAGDPAPVQDPPITRLFRMPFSRPWKPPARPARAPAGARGICWPGSTAPIAGIVPCYLKSHSQGEYVFDRGWADAYERAGGRYYPKLQASVPFTPATGPRLLIRNGVDADRDRRGAGRRTGGAVRRHQAPPRSTSPLRAKPKRSFWPNTASCCATTSSFTGTTRATAASTIFSPPSIRATARRSSASGAMRWPAASRFMR